MAKKDIQDTVESTVEVAVEPQPDATNDRIATLHDTCLKYIIATRLAGVEPVEFLQNKIAEIAD